MKKFKSKLYMVIGTLMMVAILVFCLENKVTWCKAEVNDGRYKNVITCILVD